MSHTLLSLAAMAARSVLWCLTHDDEHRAVFVWQRDDFTIYARIPWLRQHHLTIFYDLPHSRDSLVTCQYPRRTKCFQILMLLPFMATGTGRLTDCLTD